MSAPNGTQRGSARHPVRRQQQSKPKAANNRLPATNENDTSPGPGINAGNASPAMEQLEQSAIPQHPPSGPGPADSKGSAPRSTLMMTIDQGRHLRYISSVLISPKLAATDPSAKIAQLRKKIGAYKSILGDFVSKADRSVIEDDASYALVQTRLYVPLVKAEEALVASRGEEFALREKILADIALAMAPLPLTIRHIVGFQSIDKLDSLLERMVISMRISHLCDYCVTKDGLVYSDEPWIPGCSERTWDIIRFSADEASDPRTFCTKEIVEFIREQAFIRGFSATSDPLGQLSSMLAGKYDPLAASAAPSLPHSTPGPGDESTTTTASEEDKERLDRFPSAGPSTRNPGVHSLDEKGADHPDPEPRLVDASFQELQDILDGIETEGVIVSVEGPRGHEGEQAFPMHVSTIQNANGPTELSTMARPVTTRGTSGSSTTDL